MTNTGYFFDSYAWEAAGLTDAGQKLFQDLKKKELPFIINYDTDDQKIEALKAVEGKTSQSVILTNADFSRDAIEVKQADKDIQKLLGIDDANRILCVMTDADAAKKLVDKGFETFVIPDDMPRYEIWPKISSYVSFHQKNAMTLKVKDAFDNKNVIVGIHVEEPDPIDEDVDLKPFELDPNKYDPRGIEDLKL